MVCKSLLHKNFCINNFYSKYSTASKKKWKSVVGLEVHAQITSKSKLFSASSTSFGSAVNSAVSLFDAAIPGTLPVLNKRCVEAGIKTALALNCKVNRISMFDRKHYFYADLPAGYQITQQRAALANNGKLNFPVIVPGKKKMYKKSVKLLQLQLEQDSGKSLHDEQLKRSLVDLNRAGLPLMELVFAPDLEDGEEAASLVKELILILKRLETCSCKMEEGALRVDANVSIHKEGDPLGTRTEVKNIGSIRSIAQAISYEIKRQIEIVENGGIIQNETRAWDADTRCTIAMRDKENLQDYRFMPEPNLPPLRLNMTDNHEEGLISVPEIASQLPKLPQETRENLIDTFALNEETAAMLVNEPILLEIFNNVLKAVPLIPCKLVTNFLLNDLLAFCNKQNMPLENSNISSTNLMEILKSLHEATINLQAARTLVEELHKTPNKSVSLLIEEKNLKQITDSSEIKKYCEIAIQNNPKAVNQYKKGKKKVLWALVGDVAKQTNQNACMKTVVQIMENLLKE